MVVSASPYEHMIGKPNVKYVANMHGELMNLITRSICYRQEPMDQYIYKDTKPSMSSLLVFNNRVYRLHGETVSHAGIFDRLCEALPL